MYISRIKKSAPETDIAHKNKVAQTLVRLDPSGARTTLAGPEQAMVGSAAWAFGRAPGDEKALYVTTDGGSLLPHESGIQDAKLVRLEVGEPGWRLLEGE